MRTTVIAICLLDPTPDFGHGVTKPKAARAAMEHNLEWFNQYVWGERPSGTR